MSAPPDDRTEALAEDLRQAVGRFVRAIRQDTHQPTNAQSETLGLLDRSGPMTTAALAEARRVKHQSMRLVIAQMEEDGIIARTANPDDARSQLNALTGKGITLLTRHRLERTRSIAALMRDQLSASEQDTLRLAVTLLDRLSAAPLD
ncbi:MarR family winged helix-turn-helix transcriptional regulator [Acidisoma silvae]|uniref:MarR family transcriptional regulator n=1 Tax=Acidisoma silvae TaxID=2802396 RepID=A0A964DXM7_9PROT|nr:MarR family transcriptional regulator [Acidisoma silvae]MCB8873873.1 MarR family transcriptional regulator [Acidisoma silvae]